MLDVVANGSLFTWAWMELFQGVNYFRRSLGLIVLIGIITSTHSCRRTALTLMNNARIPLRVIQEISGHRNLEQLQNYRIH